jgi:hypothetical protein
MYYSKKSNQKATSKRYAVSANPRGIVGQKKVPAGMGSGPIAGVKHSVIASPKTDARKGGKSISKQLTNSIVKAIECILMFFIFFFTFVALVLKVVMVVLTKIGAVILNLFGKDLRKKPKRAASFGNLFLNFLGEADLSMFASISQRKALCIVPVFIKQNSRHKGFYTTKKYFVLMGLPNPDASVEAYLVIHANHGKAVVLMNEIVSKCGVGNIYVTTLPATLTAASELIDNYNKAHGPARKVTLGLAVDALEVIMATFQAFADLPANKANSIVIIQSGGFHVKGVGGGHPNIWDAVTGKISGEVDLTFVMGEGTCCYDNWYSVDNINWIRADPSIYNSATLTGLVPNSYVWVKYQLIDAHGPEGFHPAIKVQVKG